MTGMPLPESMEPHRAAIEATLRPCVLFDVDEQLRPAPWSSKVGGSPYRLLGEPWPMHHDKPLQFLAQVNLAEVPRLPGFPERGILQFWITDDDAYGLTFDGSEQTAFRTCTFVAAPVEDPTRLDSSTPPVPKISPLASPERSIGLRSRLVTLPMTPVDHRFEGLGVDMHADEVWDHYGDIADLFPHGSRHRLGGYPFFTQEDPRGAGDDSELLFQLDSEGELWMWGDVGVANWFIRPSDLAARDFSRVRFNWDCT